MNEHILIVDDESSIRDMVRMAFEMEGFTISDANSAHNALKVLADNNIDLILLDWMMPGMSGIELATKLKKEQRFESTGIIMLTAKDDEGDRIRGLNIGADDYVCKPFSTKELIARAQAVLRRTNKSNTPQASLLKAGSIEINSEQHQVTINEQAIDLSPTEYRLLYFLMSHPDRVFTRTQLLDQVWGENIYVEERTVDVHIRRLRKILEAFKCEDYIHTVRSVGYRFSQPKL